MNDLTALRILIPLRFTLGCGYFVAPPLGNASPRADCAVPPVKLRAVVPLEQRRSGPPRRVPSGPHPLSSACHRTPSPGPSRKREGSSFFFIPLPHQREGLGEGVWSTETFE